MDSREQAEAQHLSRDSQRIFASHQHPSRMAIPAMNPDAGMAGWRSITAAKPST